MSWKNRKYSKIEAVRMTSQMYEGAWKGRVSVDELACLKRVLGGRGKNLDFRIMDEFGVTPSGKEETV